jgi:predicted amidophosphoribosyltransferase
MGVINCRFCNGLMSDRAKFLRCPHCQELFEENSRICSRCKGPAHADEDCGTCGYPHPRNLAQCTSCGNVVSRARRVVLNLSDDSSIERQAPCPAAMIPPH